MSSGGPGALSCLVRQMVAVRSSRPQWLQDLHPPLSQGGGRGRDRDEMASGEGALLSEDPLCGPGAWHSACELVLKQPGGEQGPPGGIAGRQVGVVPLRGSTSCCKTGEDRVGTAAAPCVPLTWSLPSPCAVGTVPLISHHCPTAVDSFTVESGCELGCACLRSTRSPVHCPSSGGAFSRLVAWIAPEGRETPLPDLF